MKTNPLVSVIVPVYKVENFLEQCVNSIKNQTYKNLEIILVDDGSPDNCHALCDDLAKTDKRIKVFHKENGGVSSARNLGLENATGEFVAFVDSDDYLEETYYENMVKLAESDTDLVVSNITILSPKSKTSCNGYEAEDITFILNSLNDFMDFAIRGFLDNPINKLFKKSLITKKFDTSLKLGEDRDFNLKYIKNIKGKIKYSNDAGYAYRFNPDSACNQKRSNIFDMLIVSTEKLKQFLLEKYGQYSCDNYFKIVETFVYSCVKKTPKQEFKTMKQKLYSCDLVQEYIKFYNPKSFKEKIKYFLIKHKMLNLFKILSK